MTPEEVGCVRRGCAARGTACVRCASPSSPVPAVERADVLTYTLASCARQRLPFAPAWRLAVVAALGGLDDDQPRDLLASFQARRSRLARWYASNMEAPAGPEPGGRLVGSSAS